MKRVALLWVVLSMLVCASAGAAPSVSTIYLNNGGMVRGEIVVDIPGAPLTVVVAGQSMQLQRADIMRIESASATAAPASETAAPAAAPELAAVPAPSAPVVTDAPVPVAPPPAPESAAIAPTPSPAPIVAPTPTGPITLQVDRRGRALLDSRWSPELQQLVMQRNDLAHSVRRNKLSGPIVMLSLGIVGFVGTAVAVNETNKAFQSCVADNPTSYSDCDEGVPFVAAVTGYTISSALIVAGGTFMMVRLLKRKRLKLQLASVDQRLREHNVVTVAQVRPHVSRNLAGLTLETRF